VGQEKACFAETEDGARLFVRATPAARCDAIVGTWTGPDGETRLAVKVTAPADKGVANKALIRLLARHLDLPKSALKISAGETARLKTIRIVADPSTLIARLQAFVSGR